MDQYAGASTFNYPVTRIEASQVFFANRIYVSKTSVLLAIDYPFSMCRVFENFLFLWNQHGISEYVFPKRVLGH